jgi:hypothetical protein
MLANYNQTFVSFVSMDNTLFAGEHQDISNDYNVFANFPQ